MAAEKVIAIVSLVIILSCIGEMTKISADCLYCIYARNKGWARIGKKCTDGVCGPFYISLQYWKDCGSPGGDYEKCTKEYDCSAKCVETYMELYGDSCTYPAKPTCKDFCRMHWCQCRTGCRTQELVLRENNIALAWDQHVVKCCDLAGYKC